MESKRNLEIIETKDASSDELLQLFIKETVEGFFSNLDSELTRKSYEATCKEFGRFLCSRITCISDLSKNHIIEYQKALKSKQLAKKTILKKMAAVSSFCKHLAFEGLVNKDLTYGINRPKAENKKETADFSDAEVKQLFDALNPKSKSFTSHKALLAIGFYTGLRSSEIRNLQIENIGREKEHHVINVKVKGDKQHEVPLPPFVYRCVMDHICFLNGLGLDTSNPKQCIFPCLRPVKNQPITAKALEKMLNRLIMKAGINRSTFKRYSPHSMRATLAGHLLNKVGAPLDQVQRALGHASPTTTMQYNKRSQDHDSSPLYSVHYL